MLKGNNMNNVRKNNNVVPEVAFLEDEDFRCYQTITRLINNILYDEIKEINCWH